MAVELAVAPHLRTIAPPGARYRVVCYLPVWRLSACLGLSHGASAASRAERGPSAKTRDLQTANVSLIVPFRRDNLPGEVRVAAPLQLNMTVLTSEWRVIRSKLPPHLPYQMYEMAFITGNVLV